MYRETIYFTDCVFPSHVSIQSPVDNPFAPISGESKISVEELMTAHDQLAENEQRELFVHGSLKGSLRSIDLRKSAVPISSEQISEKWDIDSSLVITMGVPFRSTAKIVFFPNPNVFLMAISPNSPVDIPLEKFPYGVNLTEEEKKRKSQIDSFHNNRRRRDQGERILRSLVQ